MAKLTQEIKDVFAKSRPFIMATADKDGKPNGVPIGLAKIISDDEIMLVDLFMHSIILLQFGLMSFYLFSLISSFMKKNLI